VALVTGAGRRVGKAIALELAARGADVIVHHRSGAAEAAEVVAEIVAGGGAAVAIAADLGDAAAGRRLVDEAVAWRGRLDVLVNSASPFTRLPFLGGDDAAWEAAWQDSLDVTLRAPARLARHAAAALAASSAPGGGVVVNVVDIAAWQAWPHYAHHGAAKAGLAWLTKTLAVALAPGVRCAGVAPGIVEWPESMAEGAQRERLLAKVPAGRAGSAADVAGAVAYLCEATYVNGTVLVVDGGRLAQTGEGG
jgi:NAD(P)-dependent dehydrogenase (short-subunit alcohol dehydrogenase family)